MQLFVKYKNRFIRIMSGILMTVALAGCASYGQTEQVAGEPERCNSGTTLVCTHRMGEVIDCSCKSKSGLEDVF